MAKSEMMITINMEPSAISVAASKVMLELWLNADRRRDIIIKERMTPDGTEVYLDLVEGPDEQKTETS